MLKKVLIVAYYWPPAGGPGVQRWLKFVKYLPDFGIEPIVFVPENASYPIVDESLNTEISSAATDRTVSAWSQPTMVPSMVVSLITPRLGTDRMV